MAKNARLSSESRWLQLTEALIELGRNVKILEARIEALEARTDDTPTTAGLDVVTVHE